MKLLHLLKISYKEKLKIVCLFLIASSFAYAQMPVRSLTDADIKRYLPRLKAEASAFAKDISEGRKTSAAIQSYSLENERFFEDIASGKTDILAWLRSHTNHIIIPPGAVYSAQCSAAETIESAIPTAVFTFGKESPYRDLLRSAAAGDKDALNEFYARRGEEESGKRNTALQAIHDFIAKTVSFYRSHGFVKVKGEFPVTWTALNSPDGSVTVHVFEMNPFSGVLPRSSSSECSSLPTGTLIEIQFKEKVSQPEISEADTGVSAAKEKPDPDYEAVKEALILARIDAADLSRLPEVEIPADAPAEVKANMRSFAAMNAVRKANAAVYKRHKAVLEPILEVFDK